MCGIYCSISRYRHSRLSESVAAALKQRGPDSIRQHDLTVNGIYLTFVSSVLSLRGSNIVPQPLVDNATGSVLCWNGEAWKIDSEPVDGNDSELVFDLLLRASADAEGSHLQVIRTLEKIQGPFALVYYDAQGQRLYYGRDCLGRRSLVKTTLSDCTVIISSICDLALDAKWAEVEADGVYVTPISQESLSKLGSDSFSFHHISHCYRSNDSASGEYIVREAFRNFEAKLMSFRTYPTLSLT
jgi:asparagine synthetase B (glutamine-hydrolysing)